jgi:hypothetical protein
MQQNITNFMVIILFQPVDKSPAMKDSESSILSQNPAFGPSSEPLISFQTSAYYFSEIHFNVIFPFLPRSHTWSLPLMFIAKVVDALLIPSVRSFEDDRQGVGVARGANNPSP